MRRHAHADGEGGDAGPSYPSRNLLFSGSQRPSPYISCHTSANGTIADPRNARLVLIIHPFDPPTATLASSELAQPPRHASLHLDPTPAATPQPPQEPTHPTPHPPPPPRQAPARSPQPRPQPPPPEHSPPETDDLHDDDDHPEHADTHERDPDPNRRTTRTDPETPTTPDPRSSPHDTPCAPDARSARPPSAARATTPMPLPTQRNPIRRILVRGESVKSTLPPVRDSSAAPYPTPPTPRGLLPPPATRDRPGKGLDRTELQGPGEREKGRPVPVDVGSRVMGAGSRRAVQVGGSGVAQQGPAGEPSASPAGLPVGSCSG